MGHRSVTRGTCAALPPKIFIADLPGGGSPKNISDTPASSDADCTFSPDGAQVAFTQYSGSHVKLVTESVNDADSKPPSKVLSDDKGSNNFNGRPDSAPDGSPHCPNKHVTTSSDTPVTIELECTDTGPAYERTAVDGFVANGRGPANGTTSEAAPTANPATVKYTPKRNFSGVDKVVYNSVDAFGPGTDMGTVFITVNAGPAKPKCAGRTATIVGTSGRDTLLGTRGRDVIVAGAGNDRVRAGPGNDIVCGGRGRDRLGGGRGHDRIGGGSGNDRANGESGNDRVGGDSGSDRVLGGTGRDRLSGGSGRDRMSGGSGNDLLGGDSGPDRLKGGSGQDRLNGGRGFDRCGGDSGRDTAARCEVLSRIG